jgi:hypothetical protein
MPAKVSRKVPTFLNEAFGYSPLQAGWIITLVSLCQIVLLPSICALSEGLERRFEPARTRLLPVLAAWQRAAPTKKPPI